MDFAMRHEGLPSRSLWDCLLGKDHKLYVHEDHQAMLQILRAGRNPTMRYLHRTHRVSVQWLHEQLGPSIASVDIRYEDTADMCADIYTKTFDDLTKWVHACDLINIVAPARMS
eukprot:12888180-Alexandrium_andersonii.AAC.1